jgi:hypothetical protein
MRLELSVILLFTCVAPLWSQEGAPASRQAELPQQKCTIQGQVVKAGTGEPLKKARVMLSKAEGRDQQRVSVLTDPGGRFLLTEIEAGRYRLFVERNGYVRQEYGQRTFNRPGSILTLAPGQRLRELVFRMVQAAVISGHVFDEDGEPVLQGRVQAMRHTYVEGKRELLTAQTSTTNDLGEFRLFGLPPGRYYLSVSYVPGGSFVGMTTAPSVLPIGAEEGYAPSYYPGTSDPARAGALELSPGEEVSLVDFRLVPTRAFRVRGRVFNSVTGEPGRGTNIWLMPRESGIRSWLIRNHTSVEDSQGAFEIHGITPGSYTISAAWLNGDKQYSTAMPLDVSNADVDGVSLVIAPGSDVSGRVQIEGRTDFNLSNLHVWLQPREEMMVIGGSASATVLRDGTFVLQNVAQETYRLYVWGMPSDFYLKAARLGADDVLEGGINLTRAKGRPELELVLSLAGARVDGLVLNEEHLPLSGAVVALVPEPSRRSQSRLYGSTNTDQYGRFTLRGIAPGEYKVFAWGDVESGAYRDPEFLRPIEDAGVTVRLVEGAAQNVELKLIPAKKPAS